VGDYPFAQLSEQGGHVLERNGPWQAELATEPPYFEPRPAAAPPGQLDLILKQIKQLQGQVTELEGWKSTAKPQLEHLETERDQLQGQVTGLQGHVTELEGHVTELEGHVTQLDGQVTKLEGWKRTAKPRLEHLQTEQDQLQEFKLVRPLLGTCLAQRRPSMPMAPSSIWSRWLYTAKPSTTSS
jgi:septal ring factor EnvC (AmiA/AmiB activator)